MIPENLQITNDMLNYLFALSSIFIPQSGLSNIHNLNVHFGATYAALINGIEAAEATSTSIPAEIDTRMCSNNSKVSAKL